MKLEINRKDWIIERLGDFAISEKGKKPKNQSETQTEEFKYPYVDIQGFEKKIFDSYTDGVKCNFCTENDFLMVWDGSRSGLVGKAVAGAIGSTLVKINLPIIENHFAYYFLKSKYLEINTNAKGTGTPHVNPDLLWNYSFPIVPILEQKAIVAKIEQLFSELDNCIANLKTAQAKLKIYRQAVLKKAFEGELTKEWREKQTNLPTADELLEQIKKEREEHYKQQLEEWKQAVKDGIKQKKPKKQKEFEPIDYNCETIPKNWVVTNLNETGYWTGGGTPSKSNLSFWTDGMIPWITPKDMKSKDLNTSQDKITEQSVKQSSAKYIKENSVLVVLRSGILRRILPVGINRVECTVNQDLQAYTPYSANENYIYWYLLSNEFDIRHKCAKDGTTVESVESNALKLYPINFPSILEQNQIVQEIESRLSVCDKIEETIEATLAKSEALRQSILKKAFEGKLLSVQELENIKNHPEYESAEALIERIKNERDK